MGVSFLDHITVLHEPYYVWIENKNYELVLAPLKARHCTLYTPKYIQNTILQLTRYSGLPRKPPITPTPAPAATQPRVDTLPSLRVMSPESNTVRYNPNLVPFITTWYHDAATSPFCSPSIPSVYTHHHKALLTHFLGLIQGRYCIWYCRCLAVFKTTHKLLKNGTLHYIISIINIPFSLSNGEGRSWTGVDKSNF